MIKVGCCGWPRGKGTYYSRFSLVEVQQTFYKLPNLETVARWRENAPPDFEFTLKAWQGVTHETRSPTWKKAGVKVPPEKKSRYGHLKPTEEVFNAWSETMKVARTLNAKIIVVQMPPSFSCTDDNVRNVRNFFNSVDRKGVDVAWEPRGDWLEKPEEVKKIVDELELIHVVDVLWDKPQSVHPISYIRLHGLGKRYNYRYVYTDKDLHALLEETRRLMREKLEVYVLFNNIAMWDSASSFKEMLKEIRP
jgi:uncharacterized protein YecE (DUF72 family)